VFGQIKAIMLSLFSTNLGRLRIVGILEGISFLVLLFVAMPLKYIYAKPEAVRQVGAIHGFLFVVFIFLLLSCAAEYGWERRKSMILVGLSMLPFGNFYADKKYLRHA
jgi:integral membrane protein